MALATCPYCGAKLFPHELRNGECSSCGRRLPANVTADAPPEPEWRGGRDRDDDPIIRRAAGASYGSYERPSGAGYGMVRVGVNMIRWGMGLLLLLVVLAVGAFFLLAFGGGGRGAFGPIGVLSVLVGLAELGVALVIFLGVCFCCTVPSGSLGAGWARGLIVCLVLVFFFGIGAFAVNISMIGRAFGGGPRDEMVVVLLLALGGLLLSAFGQQLCFFMLLRGVARDFGDHDLGGGFFAYFITSIILPIVAVGGAFLLGAAMWDARPAPGDFMAVVGVLDCVGLVVGVAMFIWLMTLLGRLYNLIPSASDADRYSYGSGGRW